MPYRGNLELPSESAKLVRETGSAVDATQSAGAIMPIEPITSSIAASISAAFKIADFILKVTAAPEEIKVFANMVQRVREDREEALRERKAKSKQLQLRPEKLKRINKILLDVNEALQIIGKIVEKGRMDGEKGKSVSTKHRFEWVLAKKEEFLVKQSYLSTCHTSLCQALTFMDGLPSDVEACADPFDSGSESDTASILLRGPTARRPKARSDVSITADLSPISIDTMSIASWEKNDDISVEEVELVRPSSSDDRPQWTQLDKREVLQSAAEAIKTLVGPEEITARSLAAPLQLSAIERRRRQRGASLLIDDDAGVFGDEFERSSARSNLDANAAAAIGPRRTSVMRRRQQIAAHFD